MLSWEEDKEKICRLLFPVLRECSNTRDVTNFSYDKERDIVIADILYMGKVSTVEINVARESGSAMVIDIVKTLM